MSTDMQPTTGNAISPSPYARFKANLAARAAELETDEVARRARSEEIISSQANRILNASSVDDIWNADKGGTVSGKDMVGVEIEIRGYVLAPSDDEYEGSDVYVNIDAVLMQDHEARHPGEEIVVNCGAPLVVTKLEMFRSVDAFPIEAVLRSYGKRGVLKLEPAPRRATRSTTTA